MVHRLEISEVRCADLGLSEVGSVSYIAHMSCLGLVLVYCACFIMPPVTVPQVLDILLIDANSREKIPERSHEVLPTPNSPRYERDFAKVFDGGENVAALKLFRSGENGNVDPAKIKSSATVKLPLPSPRPALIPMPLPMPIPVTKVSHLPLPAPARRTAGIAAVLPAPLPAVVISPPIVPEPTSTVRTAETPLPVTVKVSRPDPTANRLDELAETQSERLQRRLLSPLEGNDVNESIPVPVVPPMGFTGSKEICDGPRPTALSSLPQFGALFAVKPAVPYEPAPPHQEPRGHAVDPELCSFMNDLERRILRNWVPAENHLDDGWNIVVEFKLRRNGEIADLKLLRSNREVRDNDAALAAVRSAAPFHHHFLEMSGDDVDISFTFSKKTLQEQNAGSGDKVEFKRF